MEQLWYTSLMSSHFRIWLYIFAKSHKSANETYETNLKKQNKKQRNVSKGQQPGIGLRRCCCYVNYSFLFILFIKCFSYSLDWLLVMFIYNRGHRAFNKIEAEHIFYFQIFLSLHLCNKCSFKLSNLVSSFIKTLL